MRSRDARGVALYGTLGHVGLSLGPRRSGGLRVADWSRLDVKHKQTRRWKWPTLYINVDCGGGVEVMKRGERGIVVELGDYVEPDKRSRNNRWRGRRVRSSLLERVSSRKQEA